MNYIYDIYLNFQEIAYDFYEWHKTDKVLHIKKIPVFKINTTSLHKAIRNKNKINLPVTKKAETYGNKSRFDACILTDGNDALAIQTNQNGIIIAKSLLLLDEESEVIDVARGLTSTEIEVVETNHIPLSFLTRYEEERKSFLLKNIPQMDEHQLSYLYFECFSEEEKNRRKSEQRIKSEITLNNDEICAKSYSFLKLIYAKT